MTQKKLASASGVSLRTIVHFEKRERTLIQTNLEALRQALESAGIEFTPGNGHGPGCGSPTRSPLARHNHRAHAHQMFRVLFGVALIAVAYAPAWAVEYHCPVIRKVDPETLYTVEQLDRGQFTVKIKEQGTSAVLSRCSFVRSQNEITCDDYPADKVVFDRHLKIKKYYNFAGQFDVQLFPDLSFVESNGRGTIAYGKCAVVSP